MTTDTLTRSERGMIEFMERNAVKKRIIHELMGLGVDELSVYFDDLTQDNASYLFQSKQPSPWYKELIKISSNFTSKELAEVYIKIMSNKATFGYGSFVFVTELRSVLKSKAKLSKEIKTKNIEKDEVVEVVEEKRVSKVNKNEVGLFTDMFEGHKVRVLGTPEKPLFVLRDVCKVLGIGNAGQVKRRLEEDPGDGFISNEPIVDTLGRKQNVDVVDEQALYDVIFDSRKKEAKRFRQWVTGTVLPSIRKSGKYEIKPEPVMDTQALLSSPKFLVEISIAYANAVEAKEEAEKLVEEAKPKVEYHDQVLKSKYMITTTEIAKTLGMNASQLNEILNQKGLIFKKGTSWVPYTDFKWLVDEGFITYHVTNWGQHLKWTERGRKLIHKIVKEDLNKYQIKSLRNIEG